MPLNLVFVRWNAYEEVRGERVAAEIQFDDRLAREVHDAVSARAAPRQPR